MLTQPITIINRLGLHARAAAKLVSAASAFESDIFLKRNGQKVNAKSIMGIMMLAAGIGTELELIADGDDERQAITALTALFANRFGEEE